MKKTPKPTTDSVTPPVSLEQVRAEHAAAVAKLADLKKSETRSADDIMDQKLAIQALAGRISGAE